ncbi:MAG: pyridoxal-dependent decarboxylase [Bacteroidetes bacterium HGW-Bacteroidetes-17]|jgi:L-2,4-diaminobutyrate decarboxylase|nr:MAG: pyridoxal-dependent decarboxylase [Bacteroidetes bacterium HGW-Bacteroidetes-17]
MQKNILTKAYNPETFRKEGHQLVDLLADYLQDCMSQKEMPVLPWIDPEMQHADWKNFLDKKSTPLEFYQKFLDQSNHLHHPNYIGHQVVPPLPIAALTDLMATFSNNGMAIYEMGPAATAIERNVIEWLLKFFGWGKNANGLLTSGGSLGNLTGLLAARQAVKEYDVWESGVDGNLAVMVSAESHYSIDRSVRIMGLGDKGIIKLPVDDQHRIKVDLLPGILNEAKNEGKIVMALVGNACSTSTGIYDHNDEMADFCTQNKIWFHIDGAHGGAAIISEKYKYLTKGIEKADSVVIDFHKMMLTPALTTAVIFKNGKTSYEAFTQKASYLLNKKGEINWFDGAGRTIECTKKAMGLKIYLMIKTYGTELFSSYVDQTYDLAREFGNIVQESPDFELAVAPDSNIVCFRLIPEGITEHETNELNSKIRERIKIDGIFYIVQTVINEKVYFRITIMNPFTTLEILKKLLFMIRSISVDLSNKFL